MDEEKLKVGQVLILMRDDKREEVAILSIGRKFFRLKDGR